MSRQTLSDTMKITLLDSGDSVRISSDEREKVESALNELVRSGARISDMPHREANEWAASIHRSDPPDEEFQVERLGNRLLVRNRSLEHLKAKAAEFAEIGIIQKGEILKIDGFFTAIFYGRSEEIKT